MQYYFCTELYEDKARKSKSAKLQLKAKRAQRALTFFPTNYERMNCKDRQSKK